MLEIQREQDWHPYSCQRIFDVLPTKLNDRFRVAQQASPDVVTWEVHSSLMIPPTCQTACSASASPATCSRLFSSASYAVRDQSGETQISDRRVLNLQDDASPTPFFSHYLFPLTTMHGIQTTSATPPSPHSPSCSIIRVEAGGTSETWPSTRFATPVPLNHTRLSRHTPSI